MTKLTAVRRAVISVSDKTGLMPLAKGLADLGVDLVSTGGTAKLIRQAGIAVRDVAELTGFPEMMDGRVKTLHPAVHGGLLALRDNVDHVGAMGAHGIQPIDLLVVSLYPFEQTVASGADEAEVIENIDIGGPAMIRAAAKNHGSVTVVVDPEDYAPLLDALREDGGTSLALRKSLAQIAYARTAAYDTAVSSWMAGDQGIAAPRRRSFAGTLAQTLRYGENPHQAAAFYTDGSARPGVATARQHQGKELSYNNINDTSAAFEAVAEFPAADGAACVIVKHANPCGVALGATAAEAFGKALDCDRTSAFGGIVALNRPLDGETAIAISEIFTEVVIAPGADEAARAVFARKKNLRLLTTDAVPDPAEAGLYVAPVAGGFLVQRLADSSEANIEAITTRIGALGPMESLLRESNGAELLLDSVTAEIPMQKLEQKPVAPFCRCGKERFLRALQQLDTATLVDLASTKPGIETKCEFCGSIVHIATGQLEQIIAARQSATD